MIGEMSMPPRLGRTLPDRPQRRFGDPIEEISRPARTTSLRVLTTLKATSQLRIAAAMMSQV